MHAQNIDMVPTTAGRRIALALAVAVLATAQTVRPAATATAATSRAATPGTRTVMAFISTAVANWDRCAQFLGKGGDGEGALTQPWCACFGVSSLHRPSSPS